MTSTQHTGVVVSAKEADAWHEQIKTIMAQRALNFGDAVDWYIAVQAAFTAGLGRGVSELYAPDWDAA